MFKVNQSILVKSKDEKVKFIVRTYNSEMPEILKNHKDLMFWIENDIIETDEEIKYSDAQKRAYNKIKGNIVKVETKKIKTFEPETKIKKKKANTENSEEGFAEVK